MADTKDFAVEREAKLFEAGSYPDKGLDVTEDDLDTIVANHVESPIRIEHTATPFDGALGVLKSVYRKGKELFGNLSFTDAAWELIKTTGQRGLSIGLKKDKSGIAETSLVMDPRIADAQVFSNADVVGFSSSLETEGEAPIIEQPTQEVATMAEAIKDTTVEDPTINMSNADLIAALKRNMPDKGDANALAEYNKNVLALVAEGRDEMRDLVTMSIAANKELKEMRMEGHISNLLRDGKLTPAMVPFARGLLACLPLKATTVKSEELVTFTVDKDGEKLPATAHFAEVVLKMLQTGPTLFSTREYLDGQDNAEFTADDARVSKLLGVTKEQWLEANGRKVGN